MRDSTQSILRSARRFFSGTILSRVTGLLRDVAMASAFGTQEATAAFLVAFRLSHLLRRVLGEGALQTAFIPHFEALRQQDPERSGLFFQTLSVGLSALLCLLIGVIMLLLGGILTYGSLSPGNQEIVYLTFLMMPSLLFICLYGLNASLLQCEKHYFLSSVAPCAFNLVWIGGVFYYWNQPLLSAMPGLSLFIIWACVAQWLVTLPKTWNVLKTLGLRLPWRHLSLYSADLRSLLKPLFLGILGISASQINNALDAIFARYAEAEGPAFLWYAIRVQQLPLALFGIAISGALLPPLARAIKNNDLAKYTHFLDFALRRTLALMLPITAGLFLMGDTCIQLIYGRGSFNLASIAGTTTCLWAYGFGLIPMTLILILGPAFYARSDYRTPTQGAFLSMGLNLFLNTLLIAGFGFGSASVAWATSVSAWVNLVFLAWHLRRIQGPLVAPTFPRALAKLSFATLVGTLSLLTVDQFLHQGSNAWKILLNEPLAFPPSFFLQSIRCLIQFSAFSIPFLVTAWLLKAEELRNWEAGET